GRRGFNERRAFRVESGRQSRFRQPFLLDASCDCLSPLRRGALLLALAGVAGGPDDKDDHKRGPVGQARQRPEDDAGDRVAESLALRVGVGVPLSEDSEQERDRSEKQPKSGNEAEYARVIGGEGPAVPVRNDSREAVVFVALVARWPAAQV